MKNRLKFILLISISVFVNAISLNAQTIYKPNGQTTAPNNNNYSADKTLMENPRIFDKKNSLKISLLSPFLQTFSLFYTRYLTTETAFQLGASTMNDFYYDSQKFTINSQTLTLEFRYLLSGTHDLCTYIQPFARFINANSKVVGNSQTYLGNGQYATYNYTENTFSTGLGFVLGSQTVFKNRIVIDVYGGPVYSIQMVRNTSAPAGTYPSSFPSSRGTLDDPLVKNYGARGGICLGFLF